MCARHKWAVELRRSTVCAVERSRLGVLHWQRIGHGRNAEVRTSIPLVDDVKRNEHLGVKFRKLSG